MNKVSTSIFLLPCSLGSNERLESIIPESNTAIIKRIKCFVVENIRSARRFIKAVDRDICIDELEFYELDKRQEDLGSLFNFLNKTKAKGKDIGVLSEAGCPAVADPGSIVVAWAHENNLRVVPLVGPSSILLALMASGFNGQNFAFVGYLPIDQSDRENSIRKLEQISQKTGQTQVMIETPYRNKGMFSSLLSTCNGATKLCVAFDLTLSTEVIKTKSIKDWKQEAPLDFHKKPCIFLISSKS